MVENRRVSGGRVVQRPLLYLGEINDSQHEAWRKSIEVFEVRVPRSQMMALFPDDGATAVDDATAVRLLAGVNASTTSWNWTGSGRNDCR